MRPQGFLNQYMDSYGLSQVFYLKMLEKNNIIKTPHLYVKIFSGKRLSTAGLQNCTNKIQTLQPCSDKYHYNDINWLHPYLTRKERSWYYWKSFGFAWN